MSKQTIKDFEEILKLRQASKKSINALIRRSTAKSSVGSVEDDDEGTADAVDVDEVFGDSKPEGGMQEVLKEILDEEDEGGSRDDTKSPDEILKSAHSPETTTVASIEPNEFFKHTFGRGKKLQQQQLPQAEDDEIDEHRQELIDRYHSLLREKRELRKRNAQAQTNICQYLRKHSIDLFPPIADRSQVQQRDDYTCLLNRIEELADIKDGEAKQFEAHMEEINGKKTLLQNEISRLNNEMQAIKLRTVNQPQLDKPACYVMSQKDVNENIKFMEALEEEMQPVRLEYVQLKRSLDMIQNKYDDILYEKEEDTDQIELQVENQVLSDKMDDTKEELARMENVMNNDVVVLTHVQMKHTQMEAKNAKMYMEAQSGKHKIKELKCEEFKLKAQLLELEEKYHLLEEQMALLRNKPMLKDYSNTLYDIDDTQRRLELEEPYSGKSRAVHKISKTA